jgi:membrane protease YdiL (CAAX protease family)
MPKPLPDRWNVRERILAGGFAIYWVLGVTHNYLRTSPRARDLAAVVIAELILVLLFAIVAFFAWEVATGRLPLDGLGFAINTRTSSGLTVLVGLGVAAAILKLPIQRTDFSTALVIPLTAVLVEEILFRPVLIVGTRKVLARYGWGWAYAVAFSAAIWALAHVTSKSASMVIGLFITGLVLGGLYAWTRTNVAGYVLHALANTGSAGAVILFTFCLILGVLAQLHNAPAQRR